MRHCPRHNAFLYGIRRTFTQIGPHRAQRIAHFKATLLVCRLLSLTPSRSRIRLRWFGGTAILDQPPMLTRAAVVTFAVLSFAAAGAPFLPVTHATYAADNRSAAKEQVEFGIKVAQNGLWREALYRWERAVQLDDTYAEAWNNLAIAYEHAGRFDDARKSYETAIKLDPKNMMIRQNY